MQNRLLIFADKNDSVRKRDPTVYTAKGLSITGKWRSPALGRQDPFKIYTLRRIVFFYNAGSSGNFDVAVTGDGGANFNETKTVPVVSGDGLRVAVGFNTSGPDLRFEIRFDEDKLINVYGYKIKLIERSDLVLP